VQLSWATCHFANIFWYSTFVYKLLLIRCLRDQQRTRSLAHLQPTTIFNEKHVTKGNRTCDLLSNSSAPYHCTTSSSFKWGIQFYMFHLCCRCGTLMVCQLVPICQPSQHTMWEVCWVGPTSFVACLGDRTHDPRLGKWEPYRHLATLRRFYFCTYLMECSIYLLNNVYPNFCKI